jgi:hypothetical protein
MAGNKPPKITDFDTLEAYVNATLAADGPPKSMGRAGPGMIVPKKPQKEQKAGPGMIVPKTAEGPKNGSGYAERFEESTERTEQWLK